MPITRTPASLTRCTLRSGGDRRGAPSHKAAPAALPTTRPITSQRAGRGAREKSIPPDMGTFVHDPPVHVNGSTSNHRPVVLLDHHSIGVLSTLACPVWSIQGMQDAPHQRIYVVRVDCDAGLTVPHHLRQPSDLRDHHRRSRGHRLEGHDAERLVKAWEDSHIGNPKEAVANTIRYVAGEIASVANAQIISALPNGIQVASRPGYDQLGPRTRGKDARHRLDQEVNTLLVNDPSHIEDHLFIRGGVAPAEVTKILTIQGVKAPGVHPVRDHVDLIGWGLESPLDLRRHEAGAADHPPGLVAQPPLHVVDRTRHLTVHMPAATAVLGRVDRRQKRGPIGVLEADCRRGYQPVVRVNEREWTDLLPQLPRKLLQDDIRARNAGEEI